MVYNLVQVRGWICSTLRRHGLDQTVLIVIVCLYDLGKQLWTCIGTLDKQNGTKSNRLTITILGQCLIPSIPGEFSKSRDWGEGSKSSGQTLRSQLIALLMLAAVAINNNLIQGKTVKCIFIVPDASFKSLHCVAVFKVNKQQWWWQYSAVVLIVSKSQEKGQQMMTCIKNLFICVIELHWWKKTSVSVNMARIDIFLYFDECGFGSLFWVLFNSSLASVSIFDSGRHLTVCQECMLLFWDVGLQTVHPTTPHILLTLLHDKKNKWNWRTENKKTHLQQYFYLVSLFLSEPSLFPQKAK